VQSYGAASEIFRDLELPSGPTVLQAEAGKGKVHVAGFGMPHVFDHFRHWVRQWGEDLSVVPKVQCEPWDLQASLRVSEESGFLFLFNYHFTEKEGSVTLALPGANEKVRLPEKGSIALPPLSGAILPLNIPVRPRVILVYATAEVLDLSSSPREVRMVLSTLPGRPVEVVLGLPKKPRSVKGGARKPSLRWANGRATLTLLPTSSETELTVLF
jgi:hypothetical protein